MVSSRPANTDLRAAWRRRHAGSLSQGVKVVFLVARTEGELQQGQLEAEQVRHGDIVQVGVADGHRLLGYKILAGHVWAFHHCQTASQVAKSGSSSSESKQSAYAAPVPRFSASEVETPEEVTRFLTI